MLPSFRISATACLVATAALALAVGGLSRSDSVIEKSYAQAFGGPGGPRAEASAGPSIGSGFNPDHLRLSSLPGNAALGPKIGIGDRITLGQADGVALSYEVIEVKSLGLRDGVDGGLPHLKMVTAVAVDQSPARTIRFLIEAEPQGTTTAALKPHVL